MLCTAMELHLVLGDNLPMSKHTLIINNHNNVVKFDLYSTMEYGSNSVMDPYLGANDNLIMHCYYP